MGEGKLWCVCVEGGFLVQKQNTNMQIFLKQYGQKWRMPYKFPPIFARKVDFIKERYIWRKVTDVCKKMYFIAEKQL